MQHRKGHYSCGVEVGGSVGVLGTLYQRNKSCYRKKNSGVGKAKTKRVKTNEQSGVCYIATALCKTYAYSPSYTIISAINATHAPRAQEVA